MDKNRINTEKGEIQNNEWRKEAEMFVLPPDILEKLGINLGQFRSPLPSPGTSHASKVNKDDLITNSKHKAPKTVIPTGLPNADDKINKLDEFNELSEAAFANASHKIVSAEQGTSNAHNSMSTSEARQANKCSSSILETASLMKKSVLLSPTFCNTDFNPNTCGQISELKESSVVPVTLICTKNVNNRSDTLSNSDAQSSAYGEIWTADVNVVNQLKGDSNDTDKNSTSLHESTTEIDSAHLKTRYPETYAALSGFSQNSNNVNTIESRDGNIKTNKMVEEFTITPKYNESNNNNNCVISTVSSDCEDSQNSVISAVSDHLEEIYSSDASNQENKSKIKIISEQILNPVQLKQIQNSCASHKSHFMPVSVETLIRKTPESGDIINNSSIHAEKKIREIESEFNEINYKDESNDVKMTRNLTETADIILSIPDGDQHEIELITTTNGLIRDPKQTIKSTTETLKTCNKKRKSINESIPDSNSSCTDKAVHSSNDKSTVTDDKVKEIATYLVQLINHRKNKQYKKEDSDKHTRIYKCYKRQPHKAKLVSQGVEKPGGKNEIKRHSVNETKLLLQESLNCIKVGSSISTDDIICIGTTSETHELSQKLCVCVDFGKLGYYDWDDVYENIHFWDHKKDVCEPELCFSIYNDGEVSPHPKDDIQLLDGPRVSASDIQSNNSEPVEETEVIYGDASFSNTSTTKKPGKRGRPTKNTKNDNVEKLDDRAMSDNNSKSVEESESTYEDRSSTSAINTPIAEQLSKRGRGRPKNTKSDNIEILDDRNMSKNYSKSVKESESTYEDASSIPAINSPIAEQPAKRGRGRPKNTKNDDVEILDDLDISDNNSISVEKSEITYEDALSTSATNTPVAEQLAKRGRGRPNNTKNDNIEILDNRAMSNNNSKSVEDTEVTNEDASSTPAINTSTTEQPAKRGRGRPKKIFTKNEIDSTISDISLSSKDQLNADNNPSQRLRSTSSFDEPLSSKKAEISSIIKIHHVKKEQVDNVLSESKVSNDVDSIENLSTNNRDSRCAVCKDEVTNENWFEHRKIHNYLAWRDTEPAVDLDDEYEVIRHLTFISKEQGSLICSKCQKQYKTPKSYYGHVQNCDGSASEMNTSTASDLNTTMELLTEKTPKKTRTIRKRAKVDEIVECGVCKESVMNVHWIEHIRLKHNYLAKREGEIPLDENNEEEVKEHLYNICKYHDGLICNKCGLKRKYLKSYFTHMIACNGPLEEKEPETVKVDIDCNEVVKCAVCQLDVYGNLWIDHIQKMHKYLAWIEGEPPLDIDDSNQVHDHLQNIVKTVGFLRCWVCDETRKRVKLFLQHVNLCESSGFEKLGPVEKNPNVGEDQFECGVCHKIGLKDQWKQHAMSKHYNIAWMVGQMPINLKNPYAVEKYLREYKIKNSLVCKVCGETRVSCYGFYAHIMICGKTEAELEELQNQCEVCNKKYVCIYRNQHMASHRDSELRKERRERDAALMASLEKERLRELAECLEPGRKRKAAERASKVIQDLKQEEDEEPLVKRSRCDSEDSVKMEEINEGESSDDVYIDSDVSDEDHGHAPPKRDKKKRPDHLAKIRRLPFRVEHFYTYLKNSYTDFCAYHLTDDCLFNDWRHTDIQSVSEPISEYLPSETESCSIKYGDNEWTTYKRFEAEKISRGFILYTGGCIQCLSWAPQPSNSNEDFYFAVVTHRGPDLPRFDKDSTPVHPGLIQIWGLTDFGVLPEFSLGLVHDYGTIWSMDWCPSGARDVLPDSEEDFTRYRLGLLAIACSNGFAYVLSVPYPDVNQSETTMCKAIPVAELRLNMDSTKKVYQATAVTWSTQKGHSIIIVGYADGTTALYDLSTKSPLLNTKENNITILYPFQDKRTENGPISGVSVTPSMEWSRYAGGVCAGGAGGAGAWGARRGATHRTSLSATGVATTTHWPSYLLYAELAVSSKVVNELEWIGGGRRAGGACASGACARCTTAVIATPPALRIVRPHPCCPEPRRPVILATLRMVPLNEQPPMKTDDLSMVIEPLTYEDTVTKYGLELKMTLKNRNPPKGLNELEQRPERFPLSDVTAVSFCPSDRYHNRVAIASHSGLVFILNAAD